MEIKRDSYLEQVKSYAWDGQVKVITGIRRCGKSYLLRTLYRNYLLEQGVSLDNIITILYSKPQLRLIARSDVAPRNRLIQFLRSEPITRAASLMISAWSNASWSPSGRTTAPSTTSNHAASAASSPATAFSASSTLTA